MSENPPINLFSVPSGDRHVHVMGICGAGAASIAWMLHLHGWKVSGCDSNVHEVMSKLFARHGIQVLQDHDPGHLVGCDAIVYSAAIRPDNPELALARSGGLPVLSRGECLAGWVSNLRSIAVCGTHGKTTTACFTTRLLQCLEQRPFWCLGGHTEYLHANAGPRREERSESILSNRIAVAEADESDGSLAYEYPAITLITNIDMDHLDHFRDAEEIERCFAEVIDHTREGVVVCADADRAMRVASRFQKGPVLTFGFSETAMLRATGLRRTAEGTTFALNLRGAPVAEMQLPVPGDHNVLNALGAMAACLLLGLDVATIVKTLPQACSELPKRRFQWLTPHRTPVRVVLDYAHHPAEIQATLAIARLQNAKRIRVIFQPHRYSRTQKLMAEFVSVFAGVEELILLPVYAASEEPIPGGESYDLYAALRRQHPGQTVLLARTIDEICAYLRRTARNGDLILVVGAGDVEKVGRILCEESVWGVPANETFKTLHRLLSEEIDLIPDEPLSRHTFYRTGGVTDVFAVPNDIPALSALCIVCKANGIPLHFLGCGSNTWFSDFGLPGVLCSLHGPDFEGYVREGDSVTVGAGKIGAELLECLEQDGLSGLEFMQGIPGAVGGWTRMNAGAHGQALWDRVTCIRAVLYDGQLRHISKEAITAGYRSVRGLTDMAIISVTLSLTSAPAETIRATRAEYSEKRVCLTGLKTCGSLFKNPGNMTAGAELDALGAKSWRVGGAFVTPQHANIIAAGKDCTASDLLALMLKMREAFARAKDVEPSPEIQGFA